MNFLSPLLLSISTNLDTASVSLSYGIKNIRITKSSTLLIAIITSLGTLISMYLGKILKYFIDPNLCNTFGCILLSCIGIYFIVEYIRLKKKSIGYDTSCYIGDDLRYKDILEEPAVLDIDKSGHIDIIEALVLSIPLTINNLSVGIAAGIIGINISMCVFFNFIFTILNAYLGNLIDNIYISNLFKKYGYFISGFILILVGIYESII